MPNITTQSFGPYTLKYGTSGSEVDIGLHEGPVRMQITSHARDVRADRFGDSVLDGIYRGGDCFLLFVLKEWDAAAKAAMWPFDTDLGLSGKIGRSMTDVAKSFVLTAIAGTPAATNGPATRTFAKAIFSPEHNKEVIFGNEERNVPLVLRCYPTEVTAGDSVLRWFTDT